MPSNTPYGFYIGTISFVLGFAMVWHIFWLGAITAIGIVVCVIARLYEKDTEYYVKAQEVEKIESERQSI